MAAVPSGMTPSGSGRGGFARRLATETKQAFKTTEFWAYTLMLLGLLIAGQVIDGDGATGDVFSGDEVWLYATILTVGYMISRGLAKAGSRDPYWDSQDTGNGESITDRVKTAAAVLKDGEQAVHHGHQTEGDGSTNELETSGQRFGR